MTLNTFGNPRPPEQHRPGTGENGKTYTVVGKIKQLHDYTRLTDFAFNATCPG